MPPKSGIVDDLIAAFTNEKVTDAMSKSLQPIMLLSIDEIITKKFSVMKKEIEKLSSDLKSRDTHIRKLQENIARLQENNTRLQDSVVKQDRRIEMLEAFTREDNLVIHGLPELYSESARTSVQSTLGKNDGMQNESVAQSEKAFIDFCQKVVHVEIHPDDISICHRLKRPNSTNSNKVQHRPLLVKFAHRKARSAVLAARSQLKGSNIYINEHLTTSAAALFAAARKLVKSKKLLGSWTLNGRVVVKFLANGAEKVMTVNNNSELESI